MQSNSIRIQNVSNTCSIMNSEEASYHVDQLIHLQPAQTQKNGLQFFSH